MAAYASTITLHRNRPTIMRAGRTHKFAFLLGKVEITNYHTTLVTSLYNGHHLGTFFKTVVAVFANPSNGATPCNLRWITYTGAATTGAFSAYSVITGLQAAPDLKTIGSSEFIIIGTI